MAAVVNQAVTAVTGMVTSPLKEGTKIPATKLKEEDLQSATVDLSTIPGKIIIVGVPAAFSPQCSDQAPGYAEKASQFEAKGVKGIYVVVVNDVFVTKAWKEHMKIKDSKLVHVLSDDGAAWSAAAGMSFDASALLGNFRSGRYAAIVEDGVVSKIWTEPVPTEVTVSSADNVLSNM